MLRFGHPDAADFTIVAFSVFLMVKVLSRAKKQEAPAVTTQACPFCVSTIALAAKRCPNCTSQL